ncbi:hypothetical protein [Rhizobium leguminosarum]|uniref:hypothetical protein n=1 Tax=Rhizobium leguminosarum TaxID=384 RepID=UPI001C92A89E|nr:hypothetical protein [Rhizobium leguminosarum]MBY2911360.1 hypothetical protein [Rhizobium leguminosarum]
MATVKAVALSTLHVCVEPGAKNDTGKLIKPAKVDVVKPGKVFDIDEAGFAEFEALGSARRATKKDIAAADPDGQLPVEVNGPSETELKAKK